MQTTFSTPNGFTVTLGQIAGLGMPWLVRSYRKAIFIRKRLSSDWFLNEEQARSFAQQLLKEFEKQESTSSFIRTRKPGWTLHRPTH
jgi:hypothetical protein